MKKVAEGKYIYSYNVIDEETGEVLSSKQSYVWSGWKGDRYKYRYNSGYVRIFFDAGFNFKKQDLALFWELIRMMNRDNLIIQKVKYRNQYQKELEWKPLSRKDIYEHLKFSKTTFDRAWRTLIDGEYIKKINVYGKKVWAVNPAYAMRSLYMPIFLYAGFQESIDKFLSKGARQKFHNMMENQVIAGEEVWQ